MAEEVRTAHSVPPSTTVTTKPGHLQRPQSMRQIWTTTQHTLALMTPECGKHGLFSNTLALITPGCG